MFAPKWGSDLSKFHHGQSLQAATLALTNQTFLRQTFWRRRKCLYCVKRSLNSHQSFHLSFWIFQHSNGDHPVGNVASCTYKNLLECNTCKYLEILVTPIKYLEILVTHKYISHIKTRWTLKKILYSLSRLSFGICQDHNGDHPVGFVGPVTSW